MKQGHMCEGPHMHGPTLISHANRVMLKIFQARLQQYVNHELPDVQTGFRKGRGKPDLKETRAPQCSSQHCLS